MSQRLSFRVKLIVVSIGIAATFGGWIFVSQDMPSNAGRDVAPLAQAEQSLQTQAHLDQPELDLPNIDVPAYESALFGMQEAMQSVGDIFRHAVTLDFGGGSSSGQSSSSREMVRSVGGAKFVSVR